MTSLLRPEKRNRMALHGYHASRFPVFNIFSNSIKVYGSGVAGRNQTSVCVLFIFCFGKKEFCERILLVAESG